VARAGGKVVKNVAGYDLGKLLTGSFGTLGIMTSVSVRLHPIPEATAWVCLSVQSSSHAAELSQRVLHSHLVPTAAELDMPAEGPGTLVVRLDGIAPGVTARVVEAQDLLATGTDAPEVLDGAPSWWGTEPGDGSGVLLKVSHEVAALEAVLDAVSGAAQAAGGTAHTRGSAAVGTLYVSVGSGGTLGSVDVGVLVARLRAAAPSFGGAVVVLEAPAEVKAALDVWGPVRGLELMRRVKDQFDPERLLSPGRFVGGI
jgi:glycolate oxidase FAD binding subunit